MEQREALAQAGRQRDEAGLDRLVKDMKAREVRATVSLAAEFQRAAANGGAGAHATALLSGLGELRYYRRFLEEAAVLQDELF